MNGKNTSLFREGALDRAKVIAAARQVPVNENTGKQKPRVDDDELDDELVV